MTKFPNNDKDNKNNPQLAPTLENFDDKHLSLACFFEKVSLDIESLELIEGSHIDIYAHCSLEYGICPYC